MSDPGTNTSATGGLMLPQPGPQYPSPLQGNPLYDLFQETLVGLSGLDTTLVRPRSQSEPANIPSQGQAWLAFGITKRLADTFAVIKHQGLAVSGDNPIGDFNIGNSSIGELDDVDGQDLLQRQEELRILCSFYDTGVSGLAYELASLVRDGFAIPQNNEPLLAQKIFLAYTGDIIEAPVLIKTQWQYRVDLEIVFRRQIDRAYRILNLLSAQAQLNWGIVEGIVGAPIGEFVIGDSEIGNEPDVDNRVTNIVVVGP